MTGRRWRPAHRVELTVALLTVAAALSPSLLPKTIVVHGVVTGVTAAVGYALGALAVWAVGPVLRRHVSAAVRDTLQWVLLVGAAALLLPAAVREHFWQRDLATMMGAPARAWYGVPAVLLVAAVTAAALVLAARGFRVVVRWLAARFTRLLPRALAVALAALLVAGLTVAVGDRMVRQQLLDAVDESLRTTALEASPTRPPPTQPTRSGGPGSLVRWPDLGDAGRQFISLPATDASSPRRLGPSPVRVYAGMQSAPDLDRRASLVVGELARTGGFDRAVLCLVIPTGSGWVNPTAVTSLEALWRSDTAIASMQYSYLPSALELVTERTRVEDAARALLDAVVRQLRQLPEEARPRLLLYGESLGSTGVEAALRTVPGADDLVDGVFLVGPPYRNQTWSELADARDPGSPVLAPRVDDGAQVRFWPGPELPAHHRTGDPWPAPAHGPRMLYLQHPSDPVVWWSPSLLWSRPQWVAEREELTGAPPLRWRPVVTFWQVTGDLLFSADVPAGHGHRYRGRDIAAGWAAVAPPAPDC